jgi:thiamine-monophosphate kinase
MTISPTPTVADLGEHAIIERIRAASPAPPDWVVVGMGDDAAVVESARNHLEVVTTDVFVEGVHFDRRYVPSSAIGHKALAVNLSDLAAMGAEPRGAVLSLVLPPGLPVAELDEIIGGWLALASRYDVALLGGNVSRSPGPLVIDVTAFGTVKPRRVLTRSGAKPRDVLYVSGAIGAAAAGFRLLSGGSEGTAVDAGCSERFLRPDPRVRLGLLLGRNRVASACVDLSDGFADAVRQLAAASRVGAEIDADAIPVPDAVRRLAAAEGRDPIEVAVSGGEDYELLFTVPPRRRRALESVLKLAKVPCARVGTIVPGGGLLLARQGARRPLPAGYTHFR